MKRIVLSVAAGAVLMLLVLTQTVKGDIPPPPPPPPGGGITFIPPCPPAPAPCPSNSPTSTPTATPTDTPTPTATPLPLTLNVRLAAHMLAPGSKQKVTITTLAGSQITAFVRFPNGDRRTHNGTANANGKMTWTYTQPSSTVTHSSRTARVTVNVVNGADTKHSVKPYTIGFAPVDVSIVPRLQNRGKAVTFWIHSSERVLVSATMHFHGGQVHTVQGRTGTDGWLQIPYTVPSNVGTGTVSVSGIAQLGKTQAHTTTTFRVR